jgi:galactokinase
VKRRGGIVPSTTSTLHSLGLSPAAVRQKAALLARADRSLTRGGARARRWSIWVPGRIEVMGKHTDYAGGRSLVCALERGLCLRAAPRRDGVVRVFDAVHARSVEVSLASSAVLPQGHWGRYVATVAERVARDFPGAGTGADIALAGDLPLDAGMSSSSALVTGIFIALSRANGLRSHAHFRSLISSAEELAGYLGAVENGLSWGPLAGGGGVGTMGGCQDHAAMLCSTAGAVSRFAWFPVRREAVITLPEDYIFALAASGVAAPKSGAALERYNRLSLSTRVVLAAWERQTGRTAPTLMSALSSSPMGAAELRAAARRVRDRRLPREWLRGRVEQFIAESCVLVPAAGDALERRAWTEFGVAVDRSQQLAEDLLGNQVPETVALQRTARELGAVGASAFGAGFGGSVWALVRADGARRFLREWEARYRAAFPGPARSATFFLSRPGGHAFQW